MKQKILIYYGDQIRRGKKFSKQIQSLKNYSKGFNKEKEDKLKFNTKSTILL